METKIVVVTDYVDGKRVRRPMVLQERKCSICGKEFMPYRRSSFQCSQNCRNKASQSRHYSKILEWHKDHWEKTKHGGIRKKLIEANGLVCSNCGKTGNSKSIVGHHVTGDPNEHDHQMLLCRACHARVHATMVPIRKQLDIETIKETVSKFGIVKGAKQLGIDVRTLRKNMQKHGVYKKHLKYQFNPISGEPLLE